MNTGKWSGGGASGSWSGGGVPPTPSMGGRGGVPATPNTGGASGSWSGGGVPPTPSMGGGGGGVPPTPSMDGGAGSGDSGGPGMGGAGGLGGFPRMELNGQSFEDRKAAMKAQVPALREKVTSGEGTGERAAEVGSALKKSMSDLANKAWENKADIGMAALTFVPGLGAAAGVVWGAKAALGLYRGYRAVNAAGKATSTAGKVFNAITKPTKTFESMGKKMGEAKNIKKAEESIEKMPPGMGRMMEEKKLADLKAGLAEQATGAKTVASNGKSASAAAKDAARKREAREEFERYVSGV